MYNIYVVICYNGRKLQSLKWSGSISNNNIYFGIEKAYLKITTCDNAICTNVQLSQNVMYQQPAILLPTDDD